MQRVARCRTYSDESSDIPAKRKSSELQSTLALCQCYSECLRASRDERYLTDACRNFLDDAFERAQDPEIDTIVIAAFWAAYVAREWTETGPNELKQNAGDALARLQSLLAGFVAGGKRVFLVLNMPTGPALDPRRMIHRTVLRPGFTVTIIVPSRVDVLQAIGPISSELRRVAARSGATIIDPLEYLCDETSCAVVSAQGEPMYRDFAHLRPSYVREKVRFLDATLLIEDR